MQRRRRNAFWMAVTQRYQAGSLRGPAAACDARPIAFAVGRSLADTFRTYRTPLGRSSKRIDADVGALSAGAYAFERTSRSWQKDFLRPLIVSLGADVLRELP